MPVSDESVGRRSFEENGIGEDDNVPFDPQQVSDNTDDESLPASIKALFCLNGATLAFPTLALSSLINDRMSIQPAYLPAYYAISFLPYSLRPIYAYLTSWICNQEKSPCKSCLYAGRCLGTKEGTLLSILQVLSAICIFATGFLREGQVVQCFALGFSQAIFISWSEFILGLSLINSAEMKSISFVDTLSLTEYNSIPKECHTHLLLRPIQEVGETRDRDNTFMQDIQKAKEDILLSLYQSQAATCRNMGSFVAQLLLFSTLIYRNMSEDAIQKNGLSDKFVTLVFIITSILPLVGSGVAYIGVMASYTKGDLGPSYSECQHQIRCKLSNDTCNIRNENGGFRCCNLSSVLLFQSILIMTGLRAPVISVSSAGLWSAITAGIVLCFVASLLWSKLCQRQGIMGTYRRSVSSVREDYEVWEKAEQGEDSCGISVSVETEDTGSDVDENQHRLSTNTRYERVALYLTLRHSVPNTNIIILNYIYTIFRSHPLFLQMLSILESFVAFLSSSFYHKKIAKRFSSISGVMIVIIVTTVIGSMIQLLYIPLIKGTKDYGNDNEPDEDDVELIDEEPRWFRKMIAFAILEAVTSCVSQLSFLPSIILATTCSDQGVENTRRFFNLGRKDLVEPRPKSSEEYLRGKQREARSHSFVEPIGRSVQYSILVSCIDFGDQLGSWIAVLLIGYLQIERENQWTNLECFISLCSIGRLLSLGFIKLIKLSP